MSVNPSQPPATSPSADPTPVVSDIRASQPQPAVGPGPGPFNGTGTPSATFPAGVDGAGPANPGPAPPVPTVPRNGPAPSAPSQPSPLAHPSAYTAISHSAPPPQHQGHPVQPGYSRPPVPKPIPSTYTQHFVGQPVYPSSQPAQISYQRAPVQQNYQAQSSRPVIIDPPRKRSSLALAMPPAHSTSPCFPSPTKDYPSASPKFSDDFSRNNFAIKQSVPEAVRQAVRDNWEKCLLGSEFHQAFVLNASMHHSTPGVQSRAVHDFGANLVANCKKELIEHFSNRDIDDVADKILAKASNAFLDKALEMRLATIEAKPLLQALARAERLGFDSGDLVEVAQGEHVIPNSRTSQMGTPGPGVGVSGPAARANGTRAAHPSELQCLKCYRTFLKKSYYDYHISRSVCSKVPPTTDGFRHSCAKCGQGFTHIGGQQYHDARNVCEGSNTGTAKEPPSSLPSTPGYVRSSGTPGFSNKATPSSQPAKPTTANVLPANRPGHISGKTASPSVADPYGHLSTDQLEALNAELLEAEKQYAGRFHDAEAIADPDQQRVRLESLRNTFGTKQSMIRKKYGVRLRERRTRAEIQAERERMGLKKGLNQESPNQSPAPPQQPSSSAWTAANKAVPADPADSTPSFKRRRVDEGSEYSSPYARQTGPTTRVSEMAGGLAASSATAAIHDPTLPPPSLTPARSYQQSGARVEIHLPSKPSPSKASSAAASASGAHNGSRPRAADSMTPDNMEIDDAQAPEEEGDGKAEVEEDDPEVISIEDSDDDDDEDIPAGLPDNVRQSLTSSQAGQSY